MSFLGPFALYRFLATYRSLQWMPCQSWAFLRWPTFDGFMSALVLLLLWSMFADIRFIASSSMYPTLRLDDRIIVEWNSKNAEVSYYIRSPAVHDIVLFRAPRNLQDFNKEDVLIKRVVAKAGDSVEYVPQGHVYVLGDNRDPFPLKTSWEDMSCVVSDLRMVDHIVLILETFYKGIETPNGVG
ncbi:hypothetical protein HHK36_008939 [Tetracentron sinense]|uniref:Peptidase S26 domain-containing protein n=1 Tax=Tetracentron sinense TaxID=13715 RepID=A0A834ZJZ3_TETSI|nr:hypothetical protein HHK36_008939 [Tetracentron sinense]